MLGVFRPVKMHNVCQIGGVVRREATIVACLVRGYLDKAQLKLPIEAQLTQCTLVSVTRYAILSLT